MSVDISSFAGASIGGVSLGLIFSIAYCVYKSVNHTQIRSSCCGRVATVSLDVSSTPMATEEAAAVAIAVAQARRGSVKEKEKEKEHVEVEI
jgi:hypothetical protein